MADDVPMAMFADDYLMVITIPFYVDDQERVWLDSLWHKDLRQHFTYLPHLHLAAPRLVKTSAHRDLVQVTDEEMRCVRFVPLPPQRSLMEFARSLPETLRTLWRETTRSKVVHSGTVGWPIPLGWLANPIALLKRRKLVLVIESATWRLDRSTRRTAAKILRHVVGEALARWFVNRADLVIATHQGYLRTLATKPRGITCVCPATWVDKDMVINDDDAAAAWRRKDRIGIKFICASRLIPNKGVQLLVEAGKRVFAEGHSLQIDIVGQGPLLDECKQMAATLPGMRVLDGVPYSEFARLLRRYHAAIVPTLSDEQPRVIFDAYSQAVPVLASNTDGNREIVEQGRTGLLFESGNISTLAALLVRAAAQPRLLERMGMEALRYAREHTHCQMHKKRARLLQLLNKSARHGAAERAETPV